MGKFVLKGKQVSEMLRVLSGGLGSGATLEKAASALASEPKKDVLVLFTDNFGNVDVKPA